MLAAKYQLAQERLGASFILIILGIISQSVVHRPPELTSLGVLIKSADLGPLYYTGSESLGVGA